MINQNMSFVDLERFMAYASTQRDVVSKLELTIDFCKSKDVLDLGCINHGWERALALGDEWPHKRIKEAARSVVGLDIMGDDARELSKRGYNILAGNAEQFDMGRKFDVVVAGDLIEHLSNIGEFLGSVSRHMRPDSRFLVTTPNPFNIEQTMLAIFENRIAVNSQHTVWMDPRVLWETIARTDLEICGFCWIKTRFTIEVRGRYLGRLINALSRFIMRIRPICNRDYAIVLRKKS